MTKIMILKKERDKRQKIEVLKQIFPGSSKPGVCLVGASLVQQVDSWTLSFLQSVLVLSHVTDDHQSYLPLSSFSLHARDQC